MRSRKEKTNLIIGIYFHPEAYPPTLNAIDELSECFSHISVIHRPHLKTAWTYPGNVDMISAGAHITMEQQKTASFIAKIRFFIQFARVFYTQCTKEKPVCILVYDSLSLYAYHLFRALLFFKHKVWYHNHDVLERDSMRKFSIGSLAARTEIKAFKYLDVFSLPSNDRKKFFPLDTFKGKYFFVPNFPSKRFYGQFYKPRKLEKTVKMIFQGQVAPFRGIEQILPLLSAPIQDYKLELGLIGPCRDEYKKKIATLAAQYGVSHKVHFNKLPYAELPAFSATYHIGIALQSEKGIMTSTIGTASNKLYEYAAVGLPVIYYNSENFTRYLGKYPWALPAELSSADIKKKIAAILQSYTQLSATAHHDFMHELNFEKWFAEVKSFLKQGLVVV